MNNCVFVGRLTKNPELRTNGDTTVTRFSIAVDRRFKKDEADFISCVAFGKTAEFIDKYFSKGNIERNTLTEFNSHNTKLLNVEETKAKIASLEYIQEELAKIGR